MNDCVFCKIINKEIPTQFVFENDFVVAINDIHPKAPIHILIIPKKHIVNANAIEENDKQIIGEIFWAIKEIVKTMNIEGYKIISNVGREGGQSIDHLHMHILSGDYSHLKEI